MLTTNKIECRVAILELLTSRICHDLISPVGAIHNGLEFMRDMGEDAGDDAIDLIGYSAKQAAARLQIFRIAYGAGGTDSTIKPENVHKAIEDFISLDGKVTQHWDPHTSIQLDEAPLGFCKILTCALMTMLEGLPKGGDIHIFQDHASDEIIITGKGANANFRDYVEEALENLLPVQDIDPRLVHSYVLGLFAKEYGFEVNLTSAENEITVSFKHS